MTPEEDVAKGGCGPINYEALAATYARFREAVPRVVEYLVRTLDGISSPAILEIGCGTADHLAALADVIAPLGGRAAGFDLSPGMLKQAGAKHPQLQLLQGDADGRFPYADGQFDLAFSVNVIHYLSDLSTHFGEARRVLRPGGRLVTVTDSEEDIRARTMTHYFPETVDREVERYHPVARLTAAMRAAGFGGIEVAHTRHASVFSPADIDRYRRRAFSALRLISEEAYNRGLARLESDYAAGPRELELLELYTYVSGRA